MTFAILGGVLGGILAIIGYLILRSQTDSIILFVLLRVGIGALVATMAGPILIPRRYVSFTEVRSDDDARTDAN